MALKHQLILLPLFCLVILIAWTLIQTDKSNGLEMAGQ